MSINPITRACLPASALAAGSREEVLRVLGIDGGRFVEPERNWSGAIIESFKALDVQSTIRSYMAFKRVAVIYAIKAAWSFGD
jgi:hypothetical protein